MSQSRDLGHLLIVVSEGREEQPGSAKPSQQRMQTFPANAPIGWETGGRPGWSALPSDGHHGNSGQPATVRRKKDRNLVVTASVAGEHELVFDIFTNQQIDGGGRLTKSRGTHGHHRFRGAHEGEWSARHHRLQTFVECLAHDREIDSIAGQDAVQPRGHNGWARLLDRL